MTPADAYSAETEPASIRIIPLRGAPEAQAGADIAAMALEAAAGANVRLRDGDILVVTQKVVSKAEGLLVDLNTITPSDIALRYAQQWGRDPRQVEVVLRESVRIVRMDRGLIIAQTRHGFVCANAGVDASNVPGDDIVCLLPRDPDASAERLRATLARQTGVELAIIISDSFGRPWRQGIVNVALGVAGMAPLADYRGQPDDFGRIMNSSVMAVADEIASAAELATGKVERTPFVIVRGYPYQRAAGSGAGMLMDPAADLFR
ncbi:MAG TPA: coenzyme F420-0:L-glutamate ligase [Ktedonobacterales bacterium]|jgi:coenzyme F420-0:L-glutamate ligase/coenzyme F420-1:gamma-L-glutamate ligase